MHNGVLRPADDSLSSLVGFALVAGLLGALRWWWPLLTGTELGRPRWLSFVHAAVPLAWAGIAFVALRFGGASEIRSTSPLQLAVTLFGVAWVAITAKCFDLLGVSVRDDAVERRNPAALAGCAGATIGVAFLYAGGSIGEGPSLWNKVFSAGIATAAWLTVWAWLEAAGRVSQAVCVERDLASGLRLGGFLAAEGLILGRAVAGTWVSAGSTVADAVRDGWPCLPLLAVAVAVEKRRQPKLEAPVPSPWRDGVVPGVFHFCAAVLYVLWLGKWK